jgi:hypothetical protein
VNRSRVVRCEDCGWALPRFDCPHQNCNGVAGATAPDLKRLQPLLDDIKKDIEEILK